MIRKLELDDLEEVFLLLNELYDNKIKKSIFTENYKKCLIDDKFYGIVFVGDDKIIGVLTSRLFNRLVKSKNLLFIDDLIVNKYFRSRGVGSKLLQEAVKYAKINDCKTIELKSYISNISSHKLYEKIGFKKTHYEFKLHL